MEFYLVGLTFPIVNTLATLAIGCQVLAILVIGLLLNKKSKVSKLWLGRLAKHGLILMLLVAVTATAGSLFFSEIAMWAPCKLCWLQRIFMYSAALLLIVAVVRRDTKIVPYVLALSLVGISISGWHYGEQIQSILDPVGHDPAAPCDLSGVSCRTTYILQFGYITIPMLAMTAFLSNILLSITMIVTSPKLTKKSPPAHSHSSLLGLSLISLVIAVAAMVMATNRSPSTQTAATELVLTPKAELTEVMVTEGTHWAKPPAVPPAINRTEQKKVVVVAGSWQKDDNPDNDYSPTTLEVEVGTTVTWVNKDKVIHTVTSDDDIFNSGNMSKGDTWSYTFNEVGEFGYYCLPHPWMRGKVIVK